MVIGIRLPGVKFKPSCFPGVGPWAIYLPLCTSVSPFMRIRVMPVFYGCGVRIK